jgi:hypothetical protein
LTKIPDNAQNPHSRANKKRTLARTPVCDNHAIVVLTAGYAKHIIVFCLGSNPSGGNMPKRLLLFVSLLGVLPLAATAQERTAREYAKVRGINYRNASAAIILGPPHACTLSKQHPCVYYGGDIDPNDPEENGLDNENDLFIQYMWTYNEVNVPSPLKISAAFTNNLSTYGIIDPKTANWDFRVGVTESNFGTSIAHGTTPAEFRATGRSAFGFAEYELLTRTTLSLPTGNVWFDVQPNCTNPNDPECGQDDPRYFESDSDGLNGINSKSTVTSNDGMGPTYFCANSVCGDMFGSWCIDEGVACGDGMSAGLLK